MSCAMLVKDRNENIISVNFSQRKKDLLHLVKETRQSEKAWKRKQWKLHFALKKSNDGYWQGIQHIQLKKKKIGILQFRRKNFATA